MDALGKVKMQCWQSQYPALRKLPCSSSMFSFEMKRKPISGTFSLVSAPPCSLSMSPKVDEKQSDSDVLSAGAALSESDSVLVRVTFMLQKECAFGERIYLVGDNPLLGLWDPSNGVPLNWSDGHVWSAQLDVPRDMKVEFKFVRLTLSGEVQWQPGPNRVLSLDRVITSSNWQASTITVSECWDTAGNQNISTEDEAVELEEVTIIQDEIQVPNPDCDADSSVLSEKTEDHPESIEEDVNSEINSSDRFEDSKSDDKDSSRSMILIPGLNPGQAASQQEEENHSSAKEINIEDYQDGSCEEGEDGADLSYNSSETEMLELATSSILQSDSQSGQRTRQDTVPTTASILQSDLQSAQKALQETFPTTASIVQSDLQLGRRAMQDTFPTTASILQNDLQWMQGIFSRLGSDTNRT